LCLYISRKLVDAGSC